jgi:hypothetical protein
MAAEREDRKKAIEEVMGCTFCSVYMINARPSERVWEILVSKSERGRKELLTDEKYGCARIFLDSSDARRELLTLARARREVVWKKSDSFPLPPQLERLCLAGAAYYKGLRNTANAMIDGTALEETTLLRSRDKVRDALGVLLNKLVTIRYQRQTLQVRCRSVPVQVSLTAGSGLGEEWTMQECVVPMPFGDTQPRELLEFKVSPFLCLLFCSR